jgi:hypothetical protein
MERPDVVHNRLANNIDRATRHDDLRYSFLGKFFLDFIPQVMSRNELHEFGEYFDTGLKQFFGRPTRSNMVHVSSLLDWYSLHQIIAPLFERACQGNPNSLKFRGPRDW